MEQCLTSSRAETSKKKKKLMLGFPYFVGGPVKSCFLLVLLEPKTFYCAYLYVIVIDIKRRTFEKIKVVVNLFFVES